MTPALASLILQAAVCGMVLAGVAVSFLTLWRAQSLLRAAGRKTDAGRPSQNAAIEVLQQNLEALQSQIQEIRQQAPAISVVPAPSRAALNLEKRSQALRMHRRGESPAQIAAMLGAPQQEIELLVKVHKIVLRSI